MSQKSFWQRLVVLGAWVVLMVSGSPAWAVDCTHHFPLAQAEREVWLNDRSVSKGTVALPDTLQRHWREEGFRARYTLDVSPCTQEAGHGLWLYRVGAPYRLSIDGQRAFPELPKLEKSTSKALNGRSPMLFALPQGAKEVAIELAAMPYIPSGIARAWEGPMTALLPEQLTEHQYHSGGMFFVSVVTVLVGLATVLLWRTRQQDDVIFWFSMMCLVWGLRGTMYAADIVHLPPLIFEQINPLMVALFAVSCIQTTLLLLKRETPKIHRLLMATGVVFTAAFISTLLAGQGALAFRLVAFLFGLAMLAVMPFLIWSGRALLGHWQAGLMSLGFAALFGTSLNDMMIVLGTLAPDRTSYILIGFSVLLLAYALVCAEYVMRALNTAESSNEHLETRVQEKTRELERSYALLRENEWARARELERARFNREIHDGLGAQLITALRGVERGALNKEQMVQILQEGLDELRMLMDSSDLGRSLYGALASWRNRWDARLQASGIQLLWSVSDDLEDIEMGSDATLQIMRILQESITNAVKHAGTESIRVEAWKEKGGASAPTFELHIQDNGKGLLDETPGTSGRGLHNMAQRAQMLGAHLTVRNVSAPEHGVFVRLSMKWPDNKRPAPEFLPSTV
jgi:signal transduction histidine kinase